MAALLSFQLYQTLKSPSLSLPLYSPRHCSHLRFFSCSSSPSPLSPLRGSLVARLGSSHYHQLESAESLAREFLSRAEGFLYSLADASVSAQDTKQTEDWFSGIANYMEIILKVLKDGLSALHVPYSYGFAIILLTVLVKAATFPLTKKQVESALAMRSLQPQVKAIQKKFAGDQERIQLETARLYKLAGVNPLAGCLPTLLTIPVWIGLYRALSNVANEGLLSEGFFWIPSLSGPTTIVARQNGSGTSWLFPFKDGQPPLGWSDTFAYLVLPVLLVISQYISTQVMQASQPQSNDPSQQSAQAVTKFLPLLIGYFALSVPSGLSLYWLTNNILSTTQQIWLQKLGGAKNPVREYMERVARDNEQQSPTGNYGSTLQNPNPNNSKPQLEESKSNQDSSSDGGIRRGERFKQIKEAEERRKPEHEAAKEIEQKSNMDSQTTVDVNSEQDKTNYSLSLNGGLGHNNGTNLNGNVSKEDVSETKPYSSNQTLPDAHNPRDQENTSDGV